jgi:hypothetical protein
MDSRRKMENERALGEQEKRAFNNALHEKAI